MPARSYGHEEKTKAQKLQHPYQVLRIMVVVSSMTVSHLQTTTNDSQEVT